MCRNSFWRLVLSASFAPKLQIPEESCAAAVCKRGIPNAELIAILIATYFALFISSTLARVCAISLQRSWTTVNNFWCIIIIIIVKKVQLVLPKLQVWDQSKIFNGKLQMYFCTTQFGSGVRCINAGPQLPLSPLEDAFSSLENR